MAERARAKTESRIYKQKAAKGAIGTRAEAIDFNEQRYGKVSKNEQEKDWDEGSEAQK